MMGNPLIAAETDDKKAKMTLVSNDSVTDAGEPIVYLNTPHPEISSAIMSIPAGATTDWMTHPVQGFVYVLEGTLTVEFADGSRKEFKAGQGFPQARSKWHRGRNDGTTPMCFPGGVLWGSTLSAACSSPRTTCARTERTSAFSFPRSMTDWISRTISSHASRARRPTTATATEQLNAEDAEDAEDCTPVSRRCATAGIFGGTAARAPTRAGVTIATSGHPERL